MQCRPEDGLTGPSAIVLRAEGVHDLSDAVATMSGLLDAADPVALVRAAPGPRVGGIGQLMQSTGPHTPGSSALHLLAPCDLQVIKAAGVTVTASLVERVIEEQAMGDQHRRPRLQTLITRPTIRCGLIFVASPTGPSSSGK